MEKARAHCYLKQSYLCHIICLVADFLQKNSALFPLKLCTRVLMALTRSAVEDLRRLKLSKNWFRSHKDPFASSGSSGNRSRLGHFCEDHEFINECRFSYTTIELLQFGIRNCTSLCDKQLYKLST